MSSKAGKNKRRRQDTTQTTRKMCILTTSYSDNEPVGAMQKLTASIDHLNHTLTSEKETGSSVKDVILRRLKIKAFEADWACVEVIKGTAIMAHNV